jgi:hypothetical protein
LTEWELSDLAKNAAQNPYALDGVARHTQEGLDFVRRSQDVGFRQAVRERDDPFEDYGSRKKR